jgi:hypothetical protein
LETLSLYANALAGSTPESLCSLSGRGLQAKFLSLLPKIGARDHEVLRAGNPSWNRLEERGEMHFPG